MPDSTENEDTTLETVCTRNKGLRQWIGLRMYLAIVLVSLLRFEPTRKALRLPCYLDDFPNLALALHISWSSSLLYSVTIEINKHSCFDLPLWVETKMHPSGRPF
jgi:hypothetical protein